MMKIKKPTKDTIALILAYGVALIASAHFGFYDLTGILVGILGVVLTGEYFSIKKTGLTISDRFKIHKQKRILVWIMWILTAILTWHFGI